MKKTTLILVFLALGLGGFVYFTEVRGTNKQEEVTQTQQQLFNFTAEDVQSLSIQTQAMTINLERSNKPEPPKWLLKSPVDEVANDAIVSYLMDLLVGKGEKITSTDNIKISEFGLDKPLATIDIKLKNQNSHRLILGKSNFNNSLLYAQVDPDIQKDGNMQLFLVSNNFANAVNRELKEWQEVSKKEDDNIKSEPLPGLPETIKN
ncbi:MAG: DUF4340 domain-containing protein [Nostocales cyanobacterium]|nr:MAG: DUF4340 domain-containing protein [Nostocales cyanobacterium]TAF12452.1 MAG: DUF4340 domain-containing protein [Nostocales cyanobacterium]